MTKFKEGKLIFQYIFPLQFIYHISENKVKNKARKQLNAILSRGCAVYWYKSWEMRLG